MNQNEHEYSLLFGGDVMLGRSFNKIFEEYPDFNPWGNLDILTKHVDFFAFNLETTITNSNEKWPNKVFNFKLNEKYANKVFSSGVDYVSTANNHIMDYQIEGMNDTLYILKQNGIKFAGSGLLTKRNYTEFKLNNHLNLKLWSMSDHYEYWKPYIWYVDVYKRNWDDVLKQIKSQINLNDFPIVSLHWGPNYIDKISDQMIEFAHELANIGVRIIHGHSAHHVLPVQYIKTNYGNCIVFYSLGDLVDDYIISEKYRNDLGCLALIKINEQGKFLSLNILPTIIKNMQVNIITNKEDKDYERVMKIMYNNF